MSQSAFGAYRLLRSLGHGGMADVWYAERTLPSGERAPVALKRIRPSLCDESGAIRMFLAEARLCLRFDHPNIVRALEAGEVAGQPFMALEMIDGVELRHVLRDSPGLLPIGFAVHVAHEIALALAYAHQLADEQGRPLGIVHRDVTPSNVMLGVDGTVKLLDFGVAKARRDQELEETRRGVVKGKIGYMAPEVIDGEPYDHRADLFSLGVVLYELLTHERLFSSLDRQGVIAPPSSLNPAVSSLLDFITMRALARDPEQRYPWAAELVTNLATVLARHPWTQKDTVELVREHMAQTGQRTRVAPSKPASTTITGRPRPRRRLVIGLGIAALALGFLAPVLAVGLSHAPVPDPPDHPRPAESFVPATPPREPRIEREPERRPQPQPLPPQLRPTRRAINRFRPVPTVPPVRKLRKPPPIDRSNLIDPFAE
jgi:eukaryotic-like serine/threonine-protein kinase